MSRPKKTENIIIRATPELKSFIKYIADRYEMSNTEVIESALKEYYNMQYSTFKTTIWED